ncbi:hypothetical protein NDU88_005646 [Pleurodeles waltl]|uniref:Uncharacterized protein n=1 Tax=Pleurodeles waltl TaxID=8319 RepID=A0AAV7TC74_PLEWA|nr:hypothetical protein NDU88_005646 [Pleurodeles waltl]
MSARDRKSGPHRQQGFLGQRVPPGEAESSTTTLRGDAARYERLRSKVRPPQAARIPGIASPSRHDLFDFQLHPKMTAKRTPYRAARQIQMMPTGWDFLRDLKSLGATPA